MDISEMILQSSDCHLDAAPPIADEVAASALTAREIDVLEAMAKGLGCKDIARTLGISEHTVRKHRSNMCTRLGLRKGAWLRGYAYAFIETFVPTLTREVVEQAVRQGVEPE